MIASATAIALSNVPLSAGAQPDGMGWVTQPGDVAAAAQPVERVDDANDWRTQGYAAETPALAYRDERGLADQSVAAFDDHLDERAIVPSHRARTHAGEASTNIESSARVETRGVASANVGLAWTTYAPQGGTHPHAMPAEGTRDRVRDRVRAPTTAHRWTLAGQIAGGSLLGSAYLSSLGIGIAAIDHANKHRRWRLDPHLADASLRTYGQSMAIPLAGPWVAVPHAQSGGAIAATLAAGMIQLGGLTLAIIATVQAKRAAHSSEARRRWAWSMDPGPVLPSMMLGASP